MTANKIQVRSKHTPKKNWKMLRFAGIFASILLLGAIVAFAFISYSGDFSAAPLELVTEGNRQIIRVPAGGNLQQAIDRAKSGDIIELQAGATYNEIVLPNKPLTDFVTIQSSAARQLPENTRVSPKQKNLMAKIITRGKSAAAVSTAGGAHHYRFVGIEFSPSNADYIYNLVYFGTESAKLSDVPHDFEIDRSYIHSIDAGVTRRGVGLNSANTVIKNSYFEGFAYPQQETQAIAGWTGTKNVKIINNYLEGGAENIIFGGSDPASAELIPTDIEVSGNHFNKPAEWKDKFTIKCLFELKNARRVQFTNNYLENNWIGSAFRITVRNQDGAAIFSTLEDILIKDNIINGTGDGINILGKDDTNPSQTLKNLTISNNLFLNIGAAGFAGGGYFVQVSDGENITIANNTAFNQGNIVTFHGALPRNFTFRDNITLHGEYGVHGLESTKSPTAQKFFQNNIFINDKNVEYTSYPPNNILVKTLQNIGFINISENDFRLSADSKFKGKSTDKSDLGSNLSLDSISKIR